MSKKVAQVIVDTLEAAGVKHCYGSVGDTMNAFAISLSKSEMKFVHTRNEEAGAFAAQGEALLMNRLTAGRGGQLWTGKSAFHQRPLRGESQRSAGHSYRHPGRPERVSHHLGG